MKIALGGPPRSGKSCMRQGLKDAVRGIPGAPYPYVITGCPDGEGSWFQETVEQDPELAAELKADYKSKFTPEFVDRVAESVQRCSLPLTLIDLGGITSPENDRICEGADAIIILAGDMSRADEWRKFASRNDLQIVAEIYSDYRGTEDVVEGVGSDNVFRGSVHYLERGEDVSERPLVRALAEYLVELTK